MILTIGGKPGSGKTTLGQHLSASLGYEHISAGGLRREAARQRGMTIDEYNLLGETDPSTDFEVDDFLVRLAHTNDNIILEGRTAAYFISHKNNPGVVNIFLDVREIVGAQRILQELRKNPSTRNEDVPQNIEAMILRLRERVRSDQERYSRHYGLPDCYAPSLHNLCIDTSYQSSFRIHDLVKERLHEHFHVPLPSGSSKD